MSFESIAMSAILFGTSMDLPTRDEGVNVFYSLDAEFFHVDGFPYAFQTLNISLGIPTLIRFGLVRDDEPLSFIMTESLDRDTEHPCYGSNGIERS
jgi:hypothetical protein